MCVYQMPIKGPYFQESLLQRLVCKFSIVETCLHCLWSCWHISIYIYRNISWYIDISFFICFICTSWIMLCFCQAPFHSFSIDVVLTFSIWLNKGIYNVITDPCSNFDSDLTKLWLKLWMGINTPQFHVDLITYPYPNISAALNYLS